LKEAAGVGKRIIGSTMNKRGGKRKMKKFLLVLLAVVVISALVFGGCSKTSPEPAPASTQAPAPSPAPSQQPIVLKLVSFKPDIPPANVFEHMLIDKVKAKSNGQLIIEWVGGPEAIPPAETPAAVQRGAMDIVSSLYGMIDTLIPGWECLGYMTLSLEEFRKSPAWDIAADLCKDKGIYLLGASSIAYPNRNMAIYSKPKIATVDDFKGMKFAVQGPAYAAMLTELGAVPAIIPMPDYFTAMERGTVDAFHVGVPGIIDWGCVDVTNYMLDELHGDSSAAFLINMGVWNSLPKNLQDVMVEAATELDIEGPEAWEGIVEEVKKEVTAAGVEIVKFSPEDEKKFYDTYMEATWGHVMKKNPELVAKLKAIVVP
jgi:TRAP-type C4-dicarboxylate transport system substrate-binding protein